MSQAMTDSDSLTSLDWESTIPCDSKTGCAHEAVALVLFHDHGHADANPWWTTCQTHLDVVLSGGSQCAGCKRPVVVQQVKYL